jgi:ribonuclease BN (tRNA processing enzyme)
VSVEAGSQLLVLDAGSGIRLLGDSLLGGPEEITLLVSHLHLDHIVGIPFFAPLYEEGRVLNLVPVPSDGGPRSPLNVLDGVYSPVRLGDLPAEVRIVDDPVGFLQERGFRLSCQELAHPGGSTGFRIDRDSRSFVYMTDNELGPLSGGSSTMDIYAGFARGADLLCHDAQYVKEEIEQKRGWGHSAVAEACTLAIQAEAEHLVLFHHDPDRSDDAVAAMEANATGVLQPHGIRCTAAFEGLEITLR